MCASTFKFKSYTVRLWHDIKQKLQNYIATHRKKKKRGKNVAYFPK